MVSIFHSADPEQSVWIKNPFVLTIDTAIGLAAQASNPPANTWSGSLFFIEVPPRRDPGTGRLAETEQSCSKSARQSTFIAGLAVWIVQACAKSGICQAPTGFANGTDFLRRAVRDAALDGSALRCSASANGTHWQSVGITAETVTALIVRGLLVRNAAGRLTLTGDRRVRRQARSAMWRQNVPAREP
jgi:hypothetical protein